MYLATEKHHFMHNMQHIQKDSSGNLLKPTGHVMHRQYNIQQL